jgi:two-component system CheB/CheR fusion protein
MDTLVVVGSSAGGIEALGVLLASLNPDFSAPIVLAQHLDPNRSSHLGEILERRTRLPIVVVGDHTPLEAGKVYVVPSNQHVVIRDGSVSLEQDHANRPRPSVDLLLSTAAKSFGERLIAVILTGSGSDGAAGAVDVKAAGGTVIIQNPETAAHPSMPLALPPTVVDHVAELDAIGPLVHDLIRGIGLPEAVPDSDALASMIDRLSAHTTIDFDKYKPSTILRRIGRRMALRHVRSLEEYRDLLESHPAELTELAKSLLIKVTEFFRDPEAFTFLRNEILPELIRVGRERGRVLRLWSAGCATGEEAYSLALLVDDALGHEAREWAVKIFATDLDVSAIAFARRGLYPENVLGNLPDDFRARYFERAEHGARVAKSIRQMVIFGQQDLNHGVPFPRIDMVTCRNLLIYFKPELQQEVLDLFAFSLHQTAGYLFLGKAETVRPSKAAFELVHKKWKIYRCISGPLPLPTRAGSLTVAAVPERIARPAGAAHIGTPLDPQQFALELGQIRRFNEVLLRFLAAGAVVVDKAYRILTINATARRLLGIRETATDQDFLHTARGLPYNDLRDGIDRVFRERVVVNLSEVEIELTADTRWLNLHIAPIHFEGSHLEFALVSVTDVTETVRARRRLDAVEAEQRQLSEELGATNLRLAELNKELQDANEELQTANEEMMLSQEELQATNEEFEATNEELQATNEELETSNEEMQATNEELETTNEELIARSAELQELTRVLTREQGRLVEMVELAPFYIIVLRGPRLIVESYNPTTSIFNATDANGRPFEEVCPPELSELLAGVRESHEKDRYWVSPTMPVHIAGRDGVPRTHQLVFTAVPSHDTEHKVDGVIVYCEDVTPTLHEEEKERLERMRLMVEHSQQMAIAMYDARSQIVHASPRFFELLGRSGVPPERVASHRWEDLVMAEDQRAAFQEVVSTGKPMRLPEVRGPNVKEGRESVWDVSLIPVFDQKHGVRYVVVSAVEITDSVTARQQIERLDRMKDDFMAIVSHELRTPLVPLTVYSEMVTRLMEESDRGQDWERRVKEAVGKFRKQIGHIERLTNDLLDAARLQEGRFAIDREPVDLRRVLEQAREVALVQSPSPPVEVRFPREDGRVVVIGDEDRLHQVVQNLLSNAARHAHSSPKIELGLNVVEDGGPRRARIVVEDHGPGIAPAETSLLFTRSLRREGRGSGSGLGLGLYICKGIVDQHGGTIRAESADGKGTRIIVELPLAERVAPA